MAERTRQRIYAQRDQARRDPNCEDLYNPADRTQP